MDADRSTRMTAIRQVELPNTLPQGHRRDRCPSQSLRARNERARQRPVTKGSAWRSRIPELRVRMHRSLKTRLSQSPS
jgi:hypothetical protein